MDIYCHDIYIGLHTRSLFLWQALHKCRLLWRTVGRDLFHMIHSTVLNAEYYSWNTYNSRRPSGRGKYDGWGSILVSTGNVLWIKGNLSHHCPPQKKNSSPYLFVISSSDI